MEITWLGHSCFRIKGRNATIVTDPYDASLGAALGPLSADIVIASKQGPHHSYTDAAKGARKVLSGPGEYEISGVLITGIRTFQDEEKGVVRGKNTSFVIDMEDLRLCYLGQIGHVPTSDQEATIGTVDVLLVPVGGKDSLNAKQAAETIRLIEPRIVLPMHYKVPQLKSQLDPLEPFLKEMGLAAQVPQPKLQVTATSLPPQMQIVVLEIGK